MASSNPTDMCLIGNKANYCKYVLLIMGPCSLALVNVYKWLYSWPLSKPEELEDHLDKIPKYSTKNKKLKAYFNTNELIKIYEMKRNKDILREFDITLLYKLIQQASNSIEIALPSDDIWTKSCPPSKKDDLEHLLYLIKEKRNLVGHKDRKITNLDDTELETAFKETKAQIAKIIIKAGREKAKIDDKVVDNLKSKLEDAIDNILLNLSITSFDKNKILEFLKKEDIERNYLKELEDEFLSELKIFTAPYFVNKLDKSIINLEYLFQAIGESQIVIVDGEAGCGKTSLTRFLLHKWISGDTSEVKGITGFDILFRIPCRDIHSRDLCYFVENELKNAQKMMADTSSLLIQLENFAILWIMDGYDESTKEFEGFLEAVLRNLPDNHKVLITTRPYFLTQLLKVNGISENKICHLSIESFRENQVKDVTGKYGIDQNKFDSYYKDLKNDRKHFLGNPLNLSLVLELWTSVDNILLMKELNTHKLYECLFEKQISDLVKRLKGRTNLEESELKLCVKKWFQDCFCKIAIESLLKAPYDLSLDTHEVHKLSNNAIDYHLIANYCLSSFLDSEESFGKVGYFYRHVIQKQALTCVYLKECNDTMLEEIKSLITFGPKPVDIKRKVDGEIQYTYRQRWLKDFFFLFECCEDDLITEIITTILCDVTCFQVHHSDLLELKNKNEDVLTAIKDIYTDSKCKMEVYGIKTPQESREITQLLLPEIEHFCCILNLDQNYDDYNGWNTVIDENKDKICFQFKRDAIIKSNSDFEKEIESIWKKCISNWETKFCSAYLDIDFRGGDLETLLKILANNIGKKFRTVTIKFIFDLYRGQNVVLDSSLLSQFASKVKVSYLSLTITSLDDFQMQFLNKVKVADFLSLNFVRRGHLLEQFFENWNWKLQTDVHKVEFDVAPEQLKFLYQHIPLEIACKTILYVLGTLDSQHVPKFERKKFRQILLAKLNFQELDRRTYNALKKVGTVVNFPF